MSGNTIKVLSIDGGGQRGLIPVKFMQSFCESAGFNKDRIFDYFDIISGSSIGAIAACAFAYEKEGIFDQVYDILRNRGKYIFTTSDIIGDGAATPCADWYKGVIMAIGGSLGIPSTFYQAYDSTDSLVAGQRILYQELTNIFGDSKMSDLKKPVIITSFEKNPDNLNFDDDSNTQVYFSNLPNSIMPTARGQNAKIVDVCMSTSAAPLYFAPYIFAADPSKPLEVDAYIDGGVAQNNTSSLALTVGKILNKTSSRACVLSLGTGLGDVGFNDEGPPPPELSDLLEIVVKIKNPIAFKEKFKVPEEKMIELAARGYEAESDYFPNMAILMDIINISTTAPQEIVAQELIWQATKLLDNIFQFRAQYYFDDYSDTPDQYNTELDNTTEEVLSFYESSCIDFYAAKETEINTFINHLSL